MLNPELDIAALAREYQQDDRIQIRDIFKPEIAERLRKCCLSEVPFDYIFHIDGQNKVVTEEEMSSLDSSQQESMQAEVMKAASKGIGFLYCGYMMNRHEEPANKSLAFLHQVYDSFKDEEVLAVFRRITGRDDLTSIDGQFTRYTRGQFLTRHSDESGSENRRIAFVFGLSAQWHPDWGGLLQFYEKDGTPRDFWTPEFNTLSLFDVRHIHGVSYITPFAAAPRLSFTGWFTDPGSAELDS